MSNILVFSEKPDLLCEMLSRVSSIARPEQAVIAVGWGSADEYAQYGADRVFVLEDLADNYPVEMVTPLLNRLITENAAALIVVGATKRGKEIAARLGTLQDAPCITDSKDMSLEESGALTTSRVVFGGIAVQTDVVDSFPVIVTIPPRTFTKTANPKDASVERLSVPVSGPIQVLERRPKTSGTINVEEADIVVCVGRGFENQEDLKLAQELADTIGGVVACTRPVAEDYHWMPEEAYVGLTGKSIKGKLHISIGSSGQIQYVAGIRDAGLIVAIDMDEKAPIWEASDYGIVGNLYDIVPLLIKEFQKA